MYRNHLSVKKVNMLWVLPTWDFSAVSGLIICVLVYYLFLVFVILVSLCLPHFFKKVFEYEV